MGLRALVTGGAGFIGSHVADVLVAQGHSVTVVDNLSTGRRENVPEAATFVLLDITSPDVASLVRDGKFDLILHHAAQMDVRKSVADPVFDGTVNILGTVRLMEAVRRARTRPRIVFASTGGALYGEFVTPPNEETFAKDPESPYAIAKLTSEYYLAYYARVHGIDAVALRYGNVYGPRQNPHGEAGVVAIFCGRILDGLPLTVFGDGRQTRDYVFVSDVAHAALVAASAVLPPVGRLDARAFNVGTGVATAVLDLTEALCRISGIRVPIEHAPARLGEQQRSVVSIDKAAAQLGWRPTVGLEDGLAMTYRWFAEQRARKAVRTDAPVTI